MIEHDLPSALTRAKCLSNTLLEEREDLIFAVRDLLDFQREAMQLISRYAWPSDSLRAVEGLVDQFRRPTPAIARVKSLLHPKQDELSFIGACLMCGGPNGAHAPHCPKA